MLLTSRRKSANVTSEAVKNHSKSMSNFKKRFPRYCTAVTVQTYTIIHTDKLRTIKQLKTRI